MLQLSHFCWKNLRNQQVIAGFPCTMGPNNGRPTIRAWTPTSMVPQRFWFRNLVLKIQLAHLWIGILLKWCEIKENVVTGKSIFVWKFVLMDLNFSNLKYFCQILQKPLQFCWANFFSVFFFFLLYLLSTFAKTYPTLKAKIKPNTLHLFEMLLEIIFHSLKCTADNPLMFLKDRNANPLHLFYKCTGHEWKRGV